MTETDRNYDARRGGGVHCKKLAVNVTLNAAKYTKQFFRSGIFHTNG